MNGTFVDSLSNNKTSICLSKAHQKVCTFKMQMRLLNGSLFKNSVKTSVRARSMKSNLACLTVRTIVALQNNQDSQGSPHKKHRGSVMYKTIQKLRM